MSPGEYHQRIYIPRRYVASYYDTYCDVYGAASLYEEFTSKFTLWEYDLDIFAAMKTETRPKYHIIKNDLMMLAELRNDPIFESRKDEYARKMIELTWMRNDALERIRTIQFRLESGSVTEEDLVHELNILDVVNRDVMIKLRVGLRAIIEPHKAKLPENYLLGEHSAFMKVDRKI